MATEREKYRVEFLLRLYDQLWNSINVRITGIWQCTGVLAGALVVLSLSEKDIIPMDVGASVIVLLTGWLLWNVQDASFWYNRNLCIVANIEKQMLEKSDARKIHYYMGEHRPQKMITHLRIQFYLGVGIGGMFLVYHFLKRVWPGFLIPWADARIDLTRALPYMVATFVVGLLRRLKTEHDRKYKEFLENSPGEWGKPGDITD
jgi:hypothetical protein